MTPIIQKVKYPEKDYYIEVVLTKFKTKDVSFLEFQEYMRYSPETYKVFKEEKTSRGKILSYSVIFLDILTKEWLIEQENSGIGFRCIKCKDTGVIHNEQSEDYYNLGK